MLICRDPNTPLDEHDKKDVDSGDDSLDSAPPSAQAPPHMNALMYNQDLQVSCNELASQLYIYVSSVRINSHPINN